MAKTGRPSKLTPALIKQAEKYLVDCDGERKPLPTVEGLALRLNIARETVYDWSRTVEDDEEADELRAAFSDIVSDLKSAQAEKLMQHSLTNRYNATIAKLILSGKHGYVEKSEVDQNVNGNVSFVNDVPRPSKDAGQGS